jgi:hypothetical protein
MKLMPDGTARGRQLRSHHERIEHMNGWLVDVTLPDGQQRVRAVLRGQRRDTVTGAWTCRVELEVWGPSRPVSWTAAWCVPPDAVERLADVDYAGVPVLEPYDPPAWRLTEDPARVGERGQLVHYYDCPADPADGLVIPPTYLYEPSPQYRPCPLCRPPLPLPRPAPRTSLDLLPDWPLPPSPPEGGEAG